MIALIKSIESILLIEAAIARIAGDEVIAEIMQVEQDVHLADNQNEKIRCGDNGIFKGVPVTSEESTLSNIAREIYTSYPFDGKYILDGEKLIICQSMADGDALREAYPGAIVNPLGDWSGGPDVDTGATNRKLGSDMAQSVTGGGLHGKDLSKADVSVNIYSMLMDYAGEVTIKIDGIAASAASVIAMAGTKVLMAPTALMMIHNPMEEKKGRASDAYRKAFWNGMRSKYASVSNVLSEGTDSEGGYLVPDEYENTLVQALEGENVIRGRSHVITTSNGTHKIPVVASKGEASWIDENGAYPEDDDTFAQVNIDAHKVGTIIKVSEELLNDSAFNLESYFAQEFARRIGTKEEDAFINGNGSSKPTGILTSAEVGVTAASDKTITADEIIDLIYSLKGSYRRNAVWVLNDSTVKVIRKLKDENGQYIWQPALKDGDHDTLLGRPILTTGAMPEIAADAKPVIFGDLS